MAVQLQNSLFAYSVQRCGFSTETNRPWLFTQGRKVRPWLALAAPALAPPPARASAQRTANAAMTPALPMAQPYARSPWVSTEAIAILRAHQDRAPLSIDRAVALVDEG